MGESVWMSKDTNVMVTVKQSEKENTELTNLGLIIPKALLSSFLHIEPPTKDSTPPPSNID